MAQNYITIDEVIKSLLIQEGDETNHRYHLYLELAVRGVKELNFDVARNIKSVELTLNDALVADVPSDFVNITRIGVVNQGLVSSVGQSDDVSLITDQGAVAGANNPYSIEWYNGYVADGSKGGVFGLKGGQNAHGYYRFDAEANKIQFASGFSGKTVVLEYISDGLSTTYDTQVHVFVEEALRAYIHWKSIQRKRTVPANAKEMARRDWYNEKRIAKARMQSFTKEEAIQTSHRNTYQAPKY